MQLTDPVRLSKHDHKILSQYTWRPFHVYACTCCMYMYTVLRFQLIPPTIHISHKEPPEGPLIIASPCMEPSLSRARKQGVPLRGSFKKLWAPFMYPLLSSYQMRREFQAKPLIIETPTWNYAKHGVQAKTESNAFPLYGSFQKLRAPFIYPQLFLLQA